MELHKIVLQDIKDEENSNQDIMKTSLHRTGNHGYLNISKNYLKLKNSSNKIPLSHSSTVFDD